jgi:hypothetical protein
MPQHLPQSVVFSQPVEVFQALSTQRIEYQEAFYVAAFIEAALPLLQMQMAIRETPDIQRTSCSQEHRYAAVGGDRFLQRLSIQLEQKLPFGRGSSSFSGQAHLISNSAPRR